MPKMIKLIMIRLMQKVIRGKELWESNNCMGCHTILGKEATTLQNLQSNRKKREGYVKAVLQSPVPWGPKGRKMVKYEMNDADAEAMIAYFKWIGNIDLNGFFDPWFPL